MLKVDFMSYKFLEGLTVADVAFEASGKNLVQLFQSAGLAVTNTMVKDLDSIEQKIKKKIEVEAEKVETLLYNFLQEIIFYKDAEMLLFNKFDIEIIPKNKKWKCVGTAYGEKIDMKKHELLVDVKAATWHKFELKETKNGWKAQVVLDI